MWNDSEVTCLLEICRDKQIIKMFDGKRYKNTEIYKLVFEEMVKKGHTGKTKEQVQAKWKALKHAYVVCKRDNTVSGVDRKECQYFELLDEILGSRPSSNTTEGVDSGVWEGTDYVVVMISFIFLKFF